MQYYKAKQKEPTKNDECYKDKRNKMLITTTFNQALENSIFENKIKIEKYKLFSGTVISYHMFFK